MDDLTRFATALAGRYEIEREIGKGGMATVYLARDIRHNRLVAVKLLDPELGAAIGVQRFQSEIQVTARLQHPNLLPLFDSGEADGLLFYVMPYVEGDTLRARLDREKELPVDEAIRITVGIASALDYAHRNQIIHRDLKPENILLQDGQPVVADFGIAFAVSRAGERITHTGLSLGTPQYMSPEQAAADRTVDARTDIYSLAVITYEMLVGEPPHTGSSAQAIVSKVLTEQPRGARESRASVPAHVEAAIDRALAKTPADRFSTAADFADALQDVSSAHVRPIRSRVGYRPTSRSTSTLIAAALALIVVGAGGALLWQRLSLSAEPIRPTARFSIPLAKGTESMVAIGSAIAISPDGARITYVGRSAAGHQLYYHELDQMDVVVPIRGSEGGSVPFYSADGQWLGFQLGNRIVKVAVAGGPVVPVCEVTGSVFGASWAANDTIVFATNTGLEEVAAAGGAPRIIAKPNEHETFRWPNVLPDQRTVLFSIYHSPPQDTVRLAAVTRKTGMVRRLTQSAGFPRYVDGGFIVFTNPTRGYLGIVSAARFDTKRLEVVGTPTVITRDVWVGREGGSDLAVARSGAMAYLMEPVTGLDHLVLVDRAGVGRSTSVDEGYYSAPRLSPDGKRIALARSPDGDPKTTDIWTYSLDGGARTRLTHDSASTSPIWVANGARIAYTRARASGVGSIDWVAADGSGSSDTLLVQPMRRRKIASAITQDGRTLLYYRQATPRLSADIWTAPVDGASPPKPLVSDTLSQNLEPSLSPDGKWFAYQSNESGRMQIYVRSFSGGGTRSVVSLDGGTEPLWSPTGREIFYRNGDRMMAAAVRVGPTFEVGNRTELFTAHYDADPTLRDYDVTPDGQTFLMLQPMKEAQQSVVVVLDWFERMRKK